MNKSLIAIATILMFSNATWAAGSCYQLFPQHVELKYASNAEQVAALYELHPKFKTMIDNTLENFESATLNQSFKMISNITEMIDIRGITTGSDGASKEAMVALPEVVQKQIVDTHNLLLNKEAMKDYLRHLLNDVGVLMMNEKDHETYGLKDMNSLDSGLSDVKIKKETYLEYGIADRNSINRVLVNRIRARGDFVAVIQDSSSGGYNSNKSKTQKFENFFEVPARGPFYDKYFGVRSSHGQEGHLLQMDYVESVLHPENRRDYWDYVTSYPKGSWVWDTLYDGMNSTYMHPEYLGPLLRRTLLIN